jgi:PEP-CTERM motif
VTFAGIVANDVTNEIRIRQPDGSYAPFTGPVPEYPYKKGDAVTLSFNATVPTQAFYAAGGPYQGQIAADGIYNINLQAPFFSGGGGPGGIGNVTTPDVSGPITAAPNSTQPTNTRLTIVYDSNADTYSLQFPTSTAVNGPASFVSGAYTGPGYTYDAATGTLASCVGVGCGPAGSQNFALSGSSDTSISAPIIGIFGTTPGAGAASGSFAGVFNLLFSGSWNLPTFNGGGATQVPEPGMMLLFGGGALALIARRRRKQT